MVLPEGEVAAQRWNRMSLVGQAAEQVAGQLAGTIAAAARGLSTGDTTVAGADSRQNPATVQTG